MAAVESGRWTGARDFVRSRPNVLEHHSRGSREVAWNDDVVAMNQFAEVLTNATEGVAAALNTEVKGVPVVVFNPLNIAREDAVEASVKFPGGMPKAVHVTGPGGKEVPAQIS